MTNERQLPHGWFVKDYADGWIYFDNEADAMRQVEATGAMWLIASSPIASKRPPQMAEASEVKRLRDAADRIMPYLIWTISDESPSHHPTMPSAVSTFCREVFGANSIKEYQDDARRRFIDSTRAALKAKLSQMEA